MENLIEKERLRKLAKLPEFRLLLTHAKFGMVTSSIGLIFLFLLVLLHEIKIGEFPEYAWGAFLSIPITILCMGIFSVFYEYYIRTTFTNSMRSMYWAWDTGVTVLPSHKDAPDRKKVLERSNSDVRIMSTTLSQYFNDVRDRVEEKVNNGVNFKFVIYNPESNAIEEKAKEEGCSSQDFKDEIAFTCRRHIGPLVKKYNDKVKVKFCDFNTPFGITIIDDREMVLSLNIYGLARSKDETPCLIIENKYDQDSVFKLYEQSFEAIWVNLTDNIPECLQDYFMEENKMNHENHTQPAN